MLARNARETMGGLFAANPCEMTHGDCTGIFELTDNRILTSPDGLWLSELKDLKGFKAVRLSDCKQKRGTSSRGASF